MNHGTMFIWSRYRTWLNDKNFPPTQIIQMARAKVYQERPNLCFRDVVMQMNDSAYSAIKGYTEN
jgi:hypothetical protein